MTIAGYLCMLVGGCFFTFGFSLQLMNIASNLAR